MSSPALRLVLVSALALSAACTAHAKKGGGPTKIAAFGPLRVGERIPGFSGVSLKGTPLGPTTPPGRFHVHVVHDQLPPMCLDDECADAAKPLVARGGHVIGGSDGKYAKTLGVTLVSSQPYKLALGLVVVTGDGGVITAIWKDAGLPDLATIAADAGL